MKNKFTVTLLFAASGMSWFGNQTPVEAQQITPASSVTPKQTSLSQPKPLPAKKKFDLTFDDLKFEMEKGSPFNRQLLTPKIDGYHNSTVKLRGYICLLYTSDAADE